MKLEDRVLQLRDKVIETLAKEYSWAINADHQEMVDQKFMTFVRHAVVEKERSSIIDRYEIMKLHYIECPPVKGSVINEGSQHWISEYDRWAWKRIR